MAGRGVPNQHLDNLRRREDSTAISEARKWFCKGFLLLCGSPGVGKSFGAVTAIYNRIQDSIKNWVDKSSWSVAEKTAGGIIWASAKEIVDNKTLKDSCRQTDFLVIDDLGKEEETRTGLAAVCDVICKRYDCKLPTIITSELTLLDISSRYGRYIAERIAENPHSRIIECAGESMRLRDSVA
jgi:DNA replication protein DnaC